MAATTDMIGPHGRTPRRRDAVGLTARSRAARMMPLARAVAFATVGVMLGMVLLNASAAAATGPAARARVRCASYVRPAWHLARFQYDASGVDVTDALSALSAATRVPIIADSGVSGRLTGRFDASPVDFIERLARLYDLDAYFDGTALHVSPVSARRTLMVRLNFAKPAALRAALASGGVADACFVLVDGAGAGVVTTNGPPAYLDRVERAARRIDGNARRRVTTAVRAIELRHAGAADRVTWVEGSPVSVEGVAGRARRQLAPADATAFGAVEYEVPLPIVTADARTNTVLVRDRPARLAHDARAVTKLDVRPMPFVVDALIANVAATDVALLPLGKSLTEIGIVSNSTGMLVPDSNALRRRIGQLSAVQRARIELDRPLSTYDGATVAFRERAGTPFTPNTAASASDAPLRAARAAAELSLLVAPSAGINAARRDTTLAIEWRVGDDGQAARVTLAASEGVAMLEPIDALRTRIVLLVPLPIDRN